MRFTAPASIPQGVSTPFSFVLIGVRDIPNYFNSLQTQLDWVRQGFHPSSLHRLVLNGPIFRRQRLPESGRSGLARIALKKRPSVASGCSRWAIGSLWAPSPPLPLSYLTSVGGDYSFSIPSSARPVNA